MIQLKDVAQRAGVSTGSVSKVLNGNSGVSERMRKKVERAIQELNYKPNFVARSLRTKSTNSIAVMVPFTNDPYFLEFFRGVSLALRNIDFVPVLYSTEPHERFSAQDVQEILMRGVDGLIVSTYGWNDSVLEQLVQIAERIPVVSFKRTFPGTPIHSVNINDHQSMFQAVNHLISVGHKRIAFLAAGLSLDVGRDRYQGYLDALTKADLVLDENLVVISESFQIENGYNAVQILLKRHPLPTAIVAANNSLAIGALKYLEGKKLRIPEDIAVMGCDDELLSTLVTPKLSSVRTPVYEMTKRAVEIIHKVIKGECDSTVNDIFPTELVIRNSTDFSAESEFEFERFSK